MYGPVAMCVNKYSQNLNIFAGYIKIKKAKFATHHYKYIAMTLNLKYPAVIFLALASGSAFTHAGTIANGRLTTALPDSLWQYSQWISAADAPVVTGRIEGRNECAADGASWFLCEIKNPAKVVSARWMTTGLGVYSLYVNGKTVGNEILKPGFTHYGKTKLSYTYDITGAIRRTSGAENVFAVQSTPGWWADKIITPGGQEGMTGRKPAFRGVIELTFADGKREYYGTDTTSWKAGIAGPVQHSAIFDGEEYDARIPSGFDTPEKLSAPEVNTEFAGQIFPSDGAEIYFREDLALKPVRAYKWQGITGASNNEHGKVKIVREYPGGKNMTLMPGETIVVDFGQNCAAVPEFEFKAKEGTTLRCLPAELLNDGNGAESRGMDGPEGSVHRRNLRVPDDGMRVDYTFGTGNKMVKYRPDRTFFGYRYVSITADNPVTIRSISSIPVTSISKSMQTGYLTTGNELINKLISNTIWGMRSNYLSVPTDCPQRNERLGWTADTQVFAETGTFFADTRRFFHKWMHDMRDTQNNAGSFPGVAPLAQYGAGANDYARLGWADAGIIVPWVVWKQFADTAIVNENWNAMMKFHNHISSTKYNHHCLRGENGDYQWADWLSYEPLESCGGGIFMQDDNGNTCVRPEAYDYWNYLSASYWLTDTEMMIDMARATGRDTTALERTAKEAREYLTRTFLMPDGTFRTPILNTMQTPALFALRNGLVCGKAKDNMIQRLRDNFADHGNCLQTGFLGTSILMPVLTENGMADIAYDLLFQRNNPSWLYSIDNGATTIWERWNSYMLDRGMGPAGMNSFNHYAYGCVCEWLWETAAGIAADPSDPGFKTIVMRPVPDRRLCSLDAEYHSPAGVIESHWKYDGDDWIWTFTVPEGARAKVQIPFGKQENIYNAGTHTVKVSRPESKASVDMGPHVAGVEFGDPFILLDDDTYYAYGTKKEREIEVYTSKDLKNWKPGGVVLRAPDSYGTRWFWAPEVYRIGNSYLMYYSADEHICVAEASSPFGPFVQKEKKPMLAGEKAIDTSLFIDTDGTPYLFFDRIMHDGYKIWVARMNPDLTSIDPSTLTLCVESSMPWETDRVNEGSFVIKRGDTYYMTYSGNGFPNPEYNVAVATSKSPYGPWTKPENNRILRTPEFQEHGHLEGVGHSAIFTDKNGQMRIVFHAHNQPGKIHHREMYIAPIDFIDGEPGLRVDTSKIIKALPTK